MSTPTSPTATSPADSGPLEWTELDKRAVDTVRVLAMDAVEKSGNGHPGTAMSLAPLAYLIFQRHLRHDPTDPDWVGRDRFVLSCGHSSLTLYIQLYFSGYGMTLDDLKSFRAYGSRTPGHPEHGHTVGVEVTTGPLGQGVANAVGMAMAARFERGLLDPDTPAGREPVRSHHLLHRLRRRPAGGHLLRGLLAGRTPAAGQPCRDLRRQQHLHRGRHVRRVERGPGRALRGLRLAHPAGDRRQRRRGPRRSPGRGQKRDRAALVHRAQVHHCLARPQRPEHRRIPRRSPGRGGGRPHQGDPRLRPGQDLRGRRQGAGPRPRGGRARPGSARGLGAGLPAVAHRPARAGGAARPDAPAPASRRAGPTSCPPSPPARRSPPARPPRR